MLFPHCVFVGVVWAGGTDFAYLQGWEYLHLVLPRAKPFTAILYICVQTSNGTKTHQGTLNYLCTSRFICSLGK